jgi:3-hydroxybutyryl-CoA dehydrogenase
MTYRIAVIGAGLMGHGIAQIFATDGHRVCVQDLLPEVLATIKERVRSNLTGMAEFGLVDGGEIDSILARIETTEDLPDACSEADIVIETIVEDMSQKQELFVELDGLCAENTILCSGTSVMSITQIGSKANRRERILGTHFWNPPYLIPLVEVVRTEETADWCIGMIYNLMRDVGKEPVVVNKDVPGFIANRMQHALWREAFAIIDEGICDAETVDIAVRNSFGLRLPVLAPVTNADLVGLDLTLAIHDYILPHLDASPEPSKTLREKVAAQQLGFKTGSGFLNWSTKSIQATRDDLSTYIMETLARQQKK